MDIDRLRAELTLEEADRLRMYYDSRGIPTIGIGHNLRDKPISQAAVDQIFADDVSEVVQQLTEKLPFWSGLDPVRQQVLADMAFNLGIDGLLGFHHTLICTQAGQYGAAAEGMRASEWFKQVGVRAVRLANMMETGTYPSP